VYIQVVPADAKVFFGVGHGGGNQFGDRAGCAVGNVPEHFNGFLHVLAAHHVNDEAYFLGGNRHVARVGNNFIFHGLPTWSSFR
jgi:hypothetical protein